MHAMLCAYVASSARLQSTRQRGNASMHRCEHKGIHDPSNHAYMILCMYDRMNLNAVRQHEYMRA